VRRLSPVGSYLALSIALAITAGACGNPDRTELLAVYEAPGGEYRLWYQDPPWTLVLVVDDQIRLEIEANGTRFGGVPVGAVPPKYVLEVATARGSAESQARLQEGAALAAGHDVLVPNREFTTFEGATGWEVITNHTATDGSRFERFVYVERSAGVVHLHFDSSADLRDPQVDVMIADLEVDVE
jgi:hypothetical protein